MSIHLKFFSTLRERLGVAEKEVEMGSPRRAREIFLGLFDDPDLAERLIRATRFAVNCEYVPPETIVHDGDEVAFIPPVSGG